MPEGASSASAPIGPPPADSAAYRWTHRSILSPVYLSDRSGAPGGRLRVDSAQAAVPAGTALLVVLATSRPLDGGLPGLDTALDLVGRLRGRLSAELLVICSRDADPARFAAAVPPGLRGVVSVEHLDRLRPALPALASAAHEFSRLRRSNDVGPKRNAGLVEGVRRAAPTCSSSTTTSARPRPGRRWSRTGCWTP